MPVLDSPPPTFEVDRTLLMDRNNWAFLEKKTRHSAAEKRSGWNVGLAIGISLLVCVPLTLFFLRTARIADKLVRTGRRASGVVVSVKSSNDEESEFCSIQYQFPAALSDYQNEIDASNQLCKTLTVGKAVDVWYDPADPSISTISAAIKAPKDPLWLVLVCGVAGILISSWAVANLRREKGLAAHGALIAGAITGFGLGDELQIRYTFRSPYGSDVEGTANGKRSASSACDVESSAFRQKYQTVAVIYLSEDVYDLL